MPTSFYDMAYELGEQLKIRKLLLTTAESCTGGGLSYFLTSVPGSSAWYDRGFVTYSNAAKSQMLGVTTHTLTEFGAVSAETAREMARGALTNSSASISIATTGIAGPDGGSADKPVGTIWIAIATSEQLSTELLQLSGDRETIRNETIKRALKKLLDIVMMVNSKNGS